jgi:hypothetical protein
MVVENGEIIFGIAGKKTVGASQGGPYASFFERRVWMWHESYSRAIQVVPS